MTILHWFRQDLRLNDNPALFWASQQDKQVVPVFIIDNKSNHGQASLWWLQQSLHSLNQSLDNKLLVFCGNPEKILPQIAIDLNAKTVTWNKVYLPDQLEQDDKIISNLTKHNIGYNSHEGQLLWPPASITKKDGSPYKVFTPFYRRGCLQAEPPAAPLPKAVFAKNAAKHKSAISIDDSELWPKHLWTAKLAKKWSPGEHSAHQKLEYFLSGPIKNYKNGRDFPSQNSTSELSPHIHWGEISVRDIWHKTLKLPQDDNTDCFLSELGWREFSYYQMYYFPKLDRENFQSKFNDFPWRHNKKALKSWQNAKTGYPIIDAAMRQLYQTGTMHNRMRMVTASFLVKNLGIDWRDGAKWFWDCLVDADMASNSAGWQWVAGCGADAAPYFRIFNPVTQGKKFDSDGTYTKQYLPELSNLETKYLFCPWEAPAEALQKAKVSLGTDYPYPNVDLKESREQALMAYKQIRKPDES
jgi:deoxyribodipyrimidine photo-lyase